MVVDFLHLRNGHEVSRNPPQKNLSPFHDAEFDVLRVGGQLNQLIFRREKKIPLRPFAPEKHLAKLLTIHFHELGPSWWGAIDAEQPPTAVLDC